MKTSGIYKNYSLLSNSKKPLKKISTYFAVIKYIFNKIWIDIFT